MSEPGNSPYRTFRVPSISRFEAFSYLGTREERAAYIAVIKEENDPELCVLASRDVKIAKHISAISKLMKVPYSELVKRIVPRYNIEQLIELCEGIDASDDAMVVSLEDEPQEALSESMDSDSDSNSDKL
jgi:DNA-binding phage protein